MLASVTRRTTLRLAMSLVVMVAGLDGCRPVAPPSSARPSEQRVVALVGATVLPMTDDGGALEDYTVLVHDGRIAAVGPRASTDVPAGAQVVDARGRFVLPGLTDMHVHLEYTEDPRILALFLAHGVTTVRSMDGRPYVLRWRDEIARGVRPGPRIVTAGPILDGDPPARPDHVRLRDSSAADAAVRAQADAGYDFVKVYTNLGADAYRGVVAAARARGLPVSGHVPRAAGLPGVLRAGQQSIEHLSDFAYHVEADSSPYRGRFHWAKLFLGMPVDSAKHRAVAARLAETTTWVVPTLLERERALVPPDTARAWANAAWTAAVPAPWRDAWVAQVVRGAGSLQPDDWRLVAAGRTHRRQVTLALHQAGVRLLPGTDTPNPFVVPGVSLHEELAAMVAAGLPTMTVLAGATREAARALGRLGEQGTVEVGKRADLVLLDKDPRRDITATRRIGGVVTQGRWVPTTGQP